MAVSKKRDKDVYKAPRNIGKPESENPKWLIPTALTLLITGVVWIVIYYITRGNWPLPIDNWNLVVGFLGLGGGMAILTRWK